MNTWGSDHAKCIQWQDIRSEFKLFTFFPQGNDKLITYRKKMHIPVI